MTQDLEHKVFNTDDLKMGLMFLHESLPGIGDAYYAYADYISRELDDEVDAMNYVLLANFLLQEMTVGVYRGTGPASVLMDRSIMFYDAIAKKIPLITEAAAPPEFSREVMEIYKELGDFF